MCLVCIYSVLSCLDDLFRLLLFVVTYSIHLYFIESLIVGFDGKLICDHSNVHIFQTDMDVAAADSISNLQTCSSLERIG